LKLTVEHLCIDVLLIPICHRGPTSRTQSGHGTRANSPLWKCSPLIQLDNWNYGWSRLI